VNPAAKSVTLLVDGVPPPSACRWPQLSPGPRASAAQRGIASVPLHVTEHACHGRRARIKCGQEELMKIAVRLLLVVALLTFAASFAQAEPRQIIQGTQIHLKLLNDISTATARNGDAFIAVTTEPVMLGDQLLLPAGTRIRGIVTSINHARHFALLRGEAYMNIAFRSVEVDSRLIPVQMSVLQIEKPSRDGEGSRRKDVGITEGQMLEEKHDIKGDIFAGTIGTGGSTVIGKLASHVAAGFGIGIAGSAIYVFQRKGREVTLPAETGMLVRMDNTVTVPGVSASTGSVNGSR
jgi:hypothetical protein